MSTKIHENIRSRLVAIIEHVIDEQKRYKSLEEITKISGATWRGFWNRNSGASGEMIEAIAQAWPQYAFWLSTGVTDPESGHIAPPQVEGVVEQINDEVPEATEYFRFQLRLLLGENQRKEGGLDLSKLIEHDAVKAIIDEMRLSRPQKAISNSNPGLLDLSVLEDPDWEKDYEAAKKMLEIKHLEKQYLQLTQLRIHKNNRTILKK